VTDPHAPASPSRESGGSDDGTAIRDFAELRALLVGSERHDLDELRRRLDALELAPEEVADILPEAIRRSMAQSDQLARALAPTIEGSIQESVEREPHKIADAIYPVLGPAIRRAIADTMAGIVSTINRAIEHSLSIQGIKWRIEAWRTGVPYGQVVIKHALVYRVERIFLIHGDTGLVLAHETAEDLEEQDADLVAGMLTAIRDFVNDSFNQDGGGDLRTFEVGERTVHVEQGPLAVVAAVVKGQPPVDFKEQLQDTVSLLHSQFGRALREFDGDPEPFLPAADLIADHLETVVEADRQHGWGWATRSTWMVAGAVAIVLFALWFAGNRRWQRAVDALNAEPGIVVLDAERSWRRWSFAGLRDPASADPGTVLAGRGVNVGRVAFSWEPYLSLSPSLAEGRVRTVLDPPPSVAISTNGDTVAVSGTAPAEWLAYAYRMRSALPGVGFLDLHAVEPRFSSEIATLRRIVEETRVLFPIGSAVWEAGSDADLDAVTAGVRRLNAAISAVGFTARYDVIGRTDTTGSRETNRTLSQRRADAVRATLVARGLSAGQLLSRGIGTTDPLRSDDPATAARINRSVSFAVRLTVTGSEGTR
jgi:OOP family OmpA-OmpF porin